MDFENLAFGSLSRIVVSADTFCYCPACREICEPEELSGIASDRQIPTCPICGERTVARPSAVGDVDAEGVELATRERERSTGGGISVSSTSGSSHRLTSRPPAPTSDRASGGRPHNHTEGAAPPSPSPANTAGGTSHQGIHERRAAVRDRVAQEVLAFIAAIERGDAATAAGFPPPPGAAAGGVVGAGGLLGGAGQGSAAVPASREAVEKLPRIEVGENSWVLHQTVLRLTGPSDISMEALLSPFSPPPVDSVFGKVVLAKPPTAHEDLANDVETRASVLIIDRGLCTFASKALRAEAAGAAVAVIIQTHDVWPYMMEDSKGEAKAAGGLGIPVCIVSKEKGQAIKEALEASKDANGEPVCAELSVSSSEKDCIVCQELFAVGATLVQLPCGHLYHEACLLKWLKLSNTCPYCRRELPTSNAQAERERLLRGAGGSGAELWQQFWD